MHYLIWLLVQYVLFYHLPNPPLLPSPKRRADACMRFACWGTYSICGWCGEARALNCGCVRCLIVCENEMR
jgi:hypothetical protein